jgi:tRNA A-37 threonylcarbamoyl transferase component Bud32/tetratricopeptide (TPR) repeat protein
MPRVVCPVCRTGFEANISRDNFALNCVACGIAFNAASYLSKDDFSSKADKAALQGSSSVEGSKFPPPAHDSTRTGGLPFMAESDDQKNARGNGAERRPAARENELAPLPRRRLIVSHPLSQRPAAAKSGEAAAVAVAVPEVIGVPTPPPITPLPRLSLVPKVEKREATPEDEGPTEADSSATGEVAPVPSAPAAAAASEVAEAESAPPAVVPAVVKVAKLGHMKAPAPEVKQKKNRRPLLEGSFGPYDIEGEIARGGVGAVFKARERDADRQVALKVLLDGEEAGESERERFRHECETAKALSLPGMVQVYAVGELEQRPYMAMELVKGRSLDKIIPEKTLSVNDCLVLMKSIAETIGALHEAGYVHRDLKPGNILLDEFGSPKVADFGLVKSLDEITRLTASGLVCGTPAYMAPEQARGDGKAVDPRSDVWALGAVLYEMLASRPPFQAENALRLMLKITKNQPTPLRSINLKVPQDVDTIVMRCLEKSPERRYPNARAMAMDIARFLNGEPLENATQPKVQQFVAAAIRNRRAIIAALCTAAMLMLVITALRYVFTPKNPQVLVEKGYSVLSDPSQKEHDRLLAAEKLFRDAATADPKNAKAQLGLGNCLGREALEAKPDNAKLDLAMQATRRAAELDAQLWPECHAQVAVFNKLMKDYVSESYELEQALKGQPGNLKFRNALAMSYWYAGSQTQQNDYFVKALKEYENILKMAPEFPHIREYIKQLKEQTIHQTVARK